MTRPQQCFRNDGRGASAAQNGKKKAFCEWLAPCPSGKRVRQMLRSMFVNKLTCALERRTN